MSIAAAPRSGFSISAGLIDPTWEQITNREYEPWERDRVVVDTATVGVDESTALIRRVIPQ